MSSATETYVNLLYKKSQGAAFTNPLTSPLEEAIGSSAVKIQPSQIWNQEIPTSEPVCQAATALPEGITYGTQSIAVNYPWIIKYTSVWLSDVPSYQRSFYYKGTESGNIIGTNILIGGIPSSQDSNGRTYMPKVYSSSDGGLNKSLINSKEWYFDGNSGYLTFLSSVTYASVYIDFWRYTGTTGISTSGPIGPAGLIGVTGPIGPAGIMSEVGEVGPVGPQGLSANTILFNMKNTRSGEITYLGNVNLPASTIVRFKLLPTSFQTNSNTNTWTQVTFLIVDSTTSAELYTLYSETFTATNLKTLTFEAAINTTSAVSGLLCISGTFTNDLLKHLDNGYMNVVKYIIPTRVYDYMGMFVPNTTTVKKVYDATKTQVLTITPLSPATMGVINIWGTPKTFCHVFGITSSDYFKFLPASDGGMYVSFFSGSTANRIYSGSTITFTPPTTVTNQGDSIIVKYNRSGTALWYARLYGPTGNVQSGSNPYGIDVVLSVCADLNDNLYIGVYSQSKTFRLYLSVPNAVTSIATLNTTSAFVIKLTDTGSYLGVSSIIGTTAFPSSSVNVYSIFYSPVNNVIYCTGNVVGTLKITAFNNQTITTYPFTSTLTDTFICKVNNSTTAVPWCVRVASSTHSALPRSAVADLAGNVIALIETRGPTVIYVAGVSSWNSVKQFAGSSPVKYDHVILKLNPEGQFLWATDIRYTTMTNMDSFATLTASDDEFYVQFRNTSAITIYSTDNSQTTVSNTVLRQFLIKYNAAGVYQWCINILRGTSLTDYDTKLTTAPSGNVYMEFSFSGIVTITDTSSIAVTHGIATSVGCMVLLVSSTGKATLVAYHDVN